MRSRTFAGRSTNVSCRRKPAAKCELVFEEVVTNILRHAYRHDREHDITVLIDFPDSAIVLQFEDDGVPFDPSKHRPATQSGSILDVRSAAED